MLPSSRCLVPRYRCHAVQCHVPSLRCLVPRSIATLSSHIPSSRCPVPGAAHRRAHLCCAWSTDSVRLATRQGASHTFAESETEAFTLHVNDTLGDDPELSHLLPLRGGSMDIFEAAKDGVLLCKLVNKASPDTVDMRCVHLGRDTPLSVYQALQPLRPVTPDPLRLSRA